MLVYRSVTDISYFLDPKNHQPPNKNDKKYTSNRYVVILSFYTGILFFFSPQTKRN